MNRTAIYAAIDNERAYQITKYGDTADRNLSIADYLLIMRMELAEVEEALVKHRGHIAVQDALSELLQVITVGVACLEEHGVVERSYHDDTLSNGMRTPTGS